ncbi:flagellar biosynthesis protein FlhF [Methylococcus sp. EFPC2]|uniref:flagellar biosynthesis protein FlhF n=1 Tax=Methylococcus sp. EFPC2 TaxID=2812648 RepID=UPI001967FD1B|nr:flagellar biosynthesis protein FlhF [Methylococcus sp. EFPC2]QSA98881.1 flagellar biosynthesis protein FlhF [Methylococcus sp. EFPC2]
MKIKRYFAPDIRQAMRMVREEQGPDAVILSNRSVDGGVEIVAARDFDEQAMMEDMRPPAAPERSSLSESQRRAEEVFREALESSGRPPRAAPREADAPREPTPSPARKPAAAKTSETIGAARHEPRYAGPSDYSRQERPAFAREEKPAPKTTPRAPAVAAETGIIPAHALQDLQKEMQRMRRALDGHFAETAWDSLTRTAPARLDLLRRLNLLGFTRSISLQLADRMGGAEDFELAWQGCRDLLAGQLPVVEDNLLDYGGIVALVGPTGVGKTTTLAKIAARFRLKHGPRQLALITADSYRIAAHDQLTTYGRLLDVPVRAVSNAEELRHTLNGFYDKRLILIDTAGMAPRDARLAEQFATLRQDDMPIRSYLVLSAASQARAMRDAVEAYAGFAPKACILTKLDETDNLGAAFSTLIERQLPVSMYTDGQQVPEDLHQARTHLLLERCFSAMDEDMDDESAMSGPYGYEEWVSRANV